MSEQASSSQSVEDMNVTVKKIDSTEFKVSCSPESTVLDLKNKLQPLANMAPRTQRLIFRGHVLEDSQTLRSAHLENGHVLHLVERSEPPETAAQAPPGQQPAHAHQGRLSFDMMGADTIISQLDLSAMIQNISASFGGQMHMITHPPVGTQDGNSAQMMQLVATASNGPEPRPTHQLTALNNFLLHLENGDYATETRGPPFSMISRVGHETEDSNILREVALASVNGAELPENLASFVQSVRDGQAEQSLPTPQPDNPTAPPTTSNDQSGARDPRRNGLDAQGRPRPVPFTSETARLTSLALSQIVRQCAGHLQSSVVPRLAQTVQALRDLAGQEDPALPDIVTQGRTVSNTAYMVGSFMLELALAAQNLSVAASGNAGPLMCAQTGFLSSDGSHPHITNRLPNQADLDVPSFRRMVQAARNSMPGGAVMGGVNTAGQVPVPPGGAGGQSQGAQPGPPSGQAAADAGTQPGANPRPQPTRGMDSPSPFAHAFYSALHSEGAEPSVRHMRLPVRLPGASDTFRLDMSYVINAIEVFLLSVPPERLSRIFGEINPEVNGANMRAQMLAAQSDEARRQLYERFAEPMLNALLDAVRQYFQLVYRVQPIRSGSSPQPIIRPTRRALARNLPSLTHPFQAIPNPARDALQAHQPIFGAIPGFDAVLGSFGDALGSSFQIPIPEGHMHFPLGGMQMDPGLNPRFRPAAPRGAQATGQRPTAAPGTQTPASTQPAPANNAQHQAGIMPGLSPRAAPFTPGNTVTRMHEGIRITVPLFPGQHMPGVGRPPMAPAAAAPSGGGAPQAAAGVHHARPAGAFLSAPELQQLSHLCTYHPATVQNFLRNAFPTAPAATAGTPAQGSQPQRPVPPSPASASPVTSTDQTPTAEPSASDQPRASAGVASAGTAATSPSASTVSTSLQGAQSTSSTPVSMPSLPPRRRPPSSGRSRPSASGDSEVSRTPASQAQAAPPAQQPAGATSDRNAAERLPPGAPPAASQGQAISTAMSFLQDPGALESIVNQPAFQNFAQSPAINQLLENMFPGVDLDQPAEVAGDRVRMPARSANQNSQRPPQAFDMQQLFSTLMPVAQQMFGGVQGNTNRASGTASSTGRPTSRPQRSRDTEERTDFPELAGLPADERDRWTEQILADRQAQKEQAGEELSDKYKVAAGRQMSEETEPSGPATE